MLGVEPDEGARLDEFVQQAVVLGERAVAPDDALGLGQAGDLLDPGVDVALAVADSLGLLLGH